MFDLSDPSQPRITSELKLPGYSQYLHLIGNRSIARYRRDADEATGLFGSMQASLFDISDPAQLKLQSQYQFEGGRGTFSPLFGGVFGLSDHLAFSYFADIGIAAIPLRKLHVGLVAPMDSMASPRPICLKSLFSR